MKFNTLNEFKQFPLAQFCMSELGYKAVKDKDSSYWRCLESPRFKLKTAKICKFLRARN